MDYALIKAVHIATVTLSGLGFAARLVGSSMGAGWVRSRLARTVPHINDTLLLVSAITLTILLQANPLMQSWLLVKILALLVYISLGVIALRPSLPGGIRLCGGVSALIVFGYIVTVALYKDPGGLLSALS